MDVLRTNGFGIEIAGEGHLALFLEGSRVNHNCRPNAFWRWVPSKMAMEVVALRGIGKGEEVAHSCEFALFCQLGVEQVADMGLQMHRSGTLTSRGRRSFSRGGFSVSVHFALRRQGRGRLLMIGETGSWRSTRR